MCRSFVILWCFVLVLLIHPVLSYQDYRQFLLSHRYPSCSNYDINSHGVDFTQAKSLGIFRGARKKRGGKRTITISFTNVHGRLQCSSTQIRHTCQSSPSPSSRKLWSPKKSMNLVFRIRPTSSSMPSNLQVGKVAHREALSGIATKS